jgi:hypothetical protein
MTDDLPTLGHYRRCHGVWTIRIYCGNRVRCWHSAIMHVDFLADEVVLKSLEPRMVCTQCGLVGADVRPDFADPSPRKKR